MPNPALPGPDTKSHARQCHHLNQRIRFYTYQATFTFGLTVNNCTLHCAAAPQPVAQIILGRPSILSAARCGRSAVAEWACPILARGNVERAALSLWLNNSTDYGV